MNLKSSFSRREVVLVVTVLCLGVVALWYTVWFRPTLHRWDNLKTESAQMQMQMKLLASRAKKPTSSQSAGTNQTDTSLPKSADGPGFLHILAQVASESHVSIASVSIPTGMTNNTGGQSNATAASAAVHPLPSLALQLNVSGTTAQMESFFAGLEAVSRPVKVSNVSIQGDKAGRINATMEVDAYYSHVS